MQLERPSVEQLLIIALVLIAVGLACIFNI